MTNHLLGKNRCTPFSLVYYLTSRHIQGDLSVLLTLSLGECVHQDHVELCYLNVMQRIVMVWKEERKEVEEWGKEAYLSDGTTYNIHVCETEVIQVRCTQSHSDYVTLSLTNNKNLIITVQLVSGG